MDNRCVFCKKPIPLTRRLQSDPYCSDEHRIEVEKAALSRLKASAEKLGVTQTSRIRVERESEDRQRVPRFETA